MIFENKPERIIQREDNLRADIWAALQKDDAICPTKMGSFSIEIDGGDVYLNGYLPPENNLPLIESIIYSVYGVVEVHNHLRTNDGILADTLDALWKEDSIRSIDVGSLTVDVRNGEVYLFGHVAQDNNLRLIESTVRSVRGVVEVHNYLVKDSDLIIQVAQALAKDERTRPFILPAGASHGWIRLGGEVPSRKDQQAAEKISSGVPGVRGVIALPRIAGESQSLLRQTAQPRIGAAVYGENGDVGVVSHVVVRPDNLLTTHVVVRTREPFIGEPIRSECQLVLPVEAFSRVKEEALFLEQTGRPLKTYPVFDPDEYPLAPFTWKAPYPYTAGEVLWSLGAIMDERGGHGTDRVIKAAPAQTIATATA